MARRITREEGILAGESCGTAVVAALDEARRLMAENPVAAREAVLVVILPDGGRSYLSKLYNDEWMRANGLLATAGAVLRVGDVLADRRRELDGKLPAVLFARTTDRVGAAIDLLQLYGISQLPVSEEPEGDALSGLVGSVSEKGLLDRTYRDPSVVERTVGEVMDRPLPIVQSDAALDDAFAILSGGAPALVAVEHDRAVGILTKLDVLEYVAHRRD
jgi:cystathionine beta-synthase